MQIKQIKQIKLKAIASIDSNLPAIVVLTAQRLLANSHITLGWWLERLSDPDLNSLAALAEVWHLDEQAGTTIMLMSMMLSNAEGIPPTDLDEVTDSSQAFCSAIQLEVLSRIGKVRLDRSKMSIADFDVSCAAWL